MKERVLEQINPARREFLKKLLAGAAFATPVIATFSVEALMPEPAYAVPNNQPCIAPVLNPAPGPVPVVGPPPNAFGPPPQTVPVQPAQTLPICTPYP